MSSSRRPSRTGLLTLVLGGFALAAAATAQENCVTAQCHATLLQAKNVHAAAEDCSSCHEPVATPHPQAGQKTFKLSQQPPELCFTCHDQSTPKFEHGPVSAGDCMACHSPHASEQKALLLEPGDALCFGCHGDIQELLAKPNVHPAIDEGCTSCHQPHGSDHPKLLAQAAPQLCVECHSDIGEQIEKASVAHPPVTSEAACASCHSPHAADQPKLLLQPEREACLSCHKTVVTAEMTVLHGPIADGKCTPCHDPHGGTQPKLLRAEFPVDPYVPYTTAEFALCFQCHKRDLLQYPDTSFATGFRDGERNLHFLHVNDPQKGRSCALCHAVHGGNNASLVAQSVPFGQWRLPLRFVKTATGGSCAPGCHKPQAYDREKPVQPGALRKTAP